MSDYFEDNNIEKPQAIVVCAAIRFGTFIVTGARHYDIIMRNVIDVLKDDVHFKITSEEQGFINQFGEFLTREEAMKAVKKSGQPFNIDRNRGDGILFSEGLY